MRLKGKSGTKPLPSLKSRIPIRTFYTSQKKMQKDVNCDLDGIVHKIVKNGD